MNEVISDYTFCSCTAGTTNMALVVSTVKVHPVPAGWEVGLCSEPETCHRWEAVEARRIVLPQAHMLYSLLCKTCFIEGAGNINSGVSCELEIICKRIRGKLSTAR